MMAILKQNSILRLLMAAGLMAGAAQGQTFHFDSSGNATLKGQYFVREVVLRNLTAQGEIGEALSVIGAATFDGAGNYSFTGRFAGSKTGTRSAAFAGTYAVASNGFLRIASFALTGADPTAVGSFAYGGVGAVGPSAFTASATENSTQVFDLIVAVPMGANMSNASLKGAYNAVYLNFPQASVGQTQQAHMAIQADGLGGLGAITAAGNATGNPSLTSQTISSATYSLSGTGGTLNFGTPASNQLIGGSQSFFVSADGNLLVGGSPTGFDLFLASPVAPSATNGAFQGFYFLGGLESDNSVYPSQLRSLPDAFYGSLNATGQGQYTSHLRLNSNGYSTEDLTSGWVANLQSNGSFTPGDGTQYWLGANGQVMLATGTGNFYSIVAGLHGPNYAPLNPKTDVFLNPLGIVNAASFAPPTNPVAPQEMVTVFGSNLASGVLQATTMPLPTTLLGTQVLVNGVPAPLLSVSPTQITLLVPSIATPDFTAYVGFEVLNGGAVCPRPAPAGSQCPASKVVTMYTNYTAPGVFSLAQNGFGPAVAVNGREVMGANNPAKSGDIVALYVTGLGPVSPSLPDGMPSSTIGQPLNWSNVYNGSGLSVYVDGYASSSIPFAGVVPGYAAGLYQINAQIPAGISNGDDYLDILTPEAEAEQVTLRIVRNSSAPTRAAQVRETVRPAGTGRRSARTGPQIPPAMGRIPR